MKKTAAILALTILIAGPIAGCGGRVKLKPKDGVPMPVKAEAAPRPATVDELITPTSQAQPKRSDEQLKRSEERRDDKFDLPPPQG